MATTFTGLKLQGDLGKARDENPAKKVEVGSVIHRAVRVVAYKV